MEFVPVILAGGRGSRMYPLTEECPKALLPVANRPLIWYPVQLLEKNGFEECIVVLRESTRQAVSEVLDRFQSQFGLRMKFSLVDIPDAEDWGTADSLRQLRSKVKSDVLLLSCDLVTSVPLHRLADLHRSRDSALTVLLLNPPPLTKDATKKRSPAAAEQDIVGVAGASELVYFAARADVEEDVSVPLSLLRRHPHVSLSARLGDAHLYLLKRWVLDLLGEQRSISSVKGELVPYLVRHQSLEKTPKASLRRQGLHSVASSAVEALHHKAYEMSSFTGVHGNSRALRQQLIRCHALVVQEQGQGEGAGQGEGEGEAAGVLCMRINTLAAYAEASRALLRHVDEFQLERIQSRVRVHSVSPDSFVGEGVHLGDKVSVKHSCLGHHCSIGERSRIVSSTLMDHVYIGEGCSLQGCVVGSHARLEAHVSLRDCQVGTNFTVTKEADLRGETLVVGGGLQF